MASICLESGGMLILTLGWNRRLHLFRVEPEVCGAGGAGDGHGRGGWQLLS